MGPVARRAVQLLGVARAGFGVYLLAAPARAGRSWFGSVPDDSPATQVLLRSVGGRDLALGAGLALLEPSASWLRATVIADVTDGLAAAAVAPCLPRRNQVLAVGGALGFAAMAAGLERLVRRPG